MFDFKPDKRLKRFYDKANKLWFDGELPGDTAIGYNPEIPGYALTLRITDDETKHTFFVIYIDKKKHFDFRQTLLSLLHEMAHVRLKDMRHGKKFEQEMIRLAVRGAFEKIW